MAARAAATLLATTLPVTLASAHPQAAHPPPPGLTPIPITIAWPWSVFEPTFQQWPARARTFTDLGLDFHQPPLNIHMAAGKPEVLVQGNAGGQVLLSTDSGGSFGHLCPPPEPGFTGSGVGILRDGTTLLAATDSNLKTHPRQTWIHRALITRAASGAVAGCRWVEKYRVEPLYAGDMVGGNCALRFSQAADGTVYYMIMNERCATAPCANVTLPVEQQYSFAALYASTDSGKSFQYRGSPGRYTDENNILPFGEQGLLALTRFQDEAGLRSTSLGGPHYKQTAITRSTDAGR